MDRTSREVVEGDIRIILPIPDKTADLAPP